MAWTGTPFYLDEKYDSGTPGEIHARLVILAVALDTVKLEPSAYPH